jgi:hypothetical protein
VRLVRRTARKLLDATDERRRLDERTSASTKVALRRLYVEYRGLAAAGGWLPATWETGFRIFSQVDEDGISLFLVAVAGDGPQTVIDLGCGNGVDASNSANLILNLGFRGLLVDGSGEQAERARAFYAAHPDTKEDPPATTSAFLTRETVNDVVSAAGFEGEVDLLSIDVDGNDYWLWQALDVVTPRFVITEVHPEHGDDDYVMPYDPAFVWSSAPSGLRHGSSIAAMVRLAHERGYRLVGWNRRGYNLFFARNDVAIALPELTVDELRRRTA